MSAELIKAFVVTEKAMRPASTKRECFYCHAQIGSIHSDDCVLVQRTVKVRFIVEYEIDIPWHWTPEQLEFHRNHGSWCADNALSEIDKIDAHCLCGIARTEYVGEVYGPHLDE